MAEVLWRPSRERIAATNLRRFIDFVNERYDIGISDYQALYEWSVTAIGEFWAAVWDFVDIRSSRPYDEVVDDPARMPGATWFTGARLNFAENLLRYRDERTAIIFRGEAMVRRSLTYAELYRDVAHLARSLAELGVGVGDRVVAFMPNMPETVVAMLAASSLGATWSSCSPDFGITGVLDRFGQIEPRVLFTADGYFYKGTTIDSLGRVAEMLPGLPTIERVVVVPYTHSEPDISGVPTAVHYRSLVAGSSGGEITYAQLPFMHPQYIMYSSGTTGLPKCMVQSAGGVLINHLKELVLHTDLTREDTIFYFTTCGWMMWNWLVSSLAVGATIVLFDGNPFHPSPEVLWQIAEEERITVFGTSAGYLSALRGSGLRPGESFDLSALKAVLSTGSPLSAEDFAFVYSAVKADVQLASISGGSDINGCFAGGNPTGPVYAGEIQCRNLGMSVEAFDERGRPVRGRQGELVCTAAAPSMPIHFWHDADGSRYHGAYFAHFPGVWRHGDFVEITDHGGVIVYGRSDATLNPAGVRIGTAEIYRHVEALGEVADSLVVGLPAEGDVRVVLFVKLAEGHTLTDELRSRIRATLRREASPRHVPATIIGVPDIPYTLNMKKVELAVRNVLLGEPVLNRDALRNPEALDGFMHIPELHRER